MARVLTLQYEEPMLVMVAHGGVLWVLLPGVHLPLGSRVARWRGYD